MEGKGFFFYGGGRGGCGRFGDDDQRALDVVDDAHHLLHLFGEHFDEDLQVAVHRRHRRPHRLGRGRRRGRRGRRGRRRQRRQRREGPRRLAGRRRQRVRAGRRLVVRHPQQTGRNPKKIVERNF